MTRTNTPGMDINTMLGHRHGHGHYLSRSITVNYLEELTVNGSKTKKFRKAERANF
jgi:hypothetical protein